MAAALAEIRKGWDERARVVGALVLRESRTRFGRNRLGFSWAVVEPLAQVALLGAAFELMGRSGPNGTDIFMFIAAGVVPFHAFSKMTTRCMGAVDANRTLLSYPLVKPVDAVAARALLEAAIYAAVFVLTAAAGIALGLGALPADPLRVAAGLALGAALGLGVGLAACAAASLVPTVERLVPVAVRVLFFTSGLFYSLSMLPSEAAAALSWNPLVHVTETVRAGMFAGFDGSAASLGYLALWALAAVTLGLHLFRIAERNPRSRMRAPQ